jgi:ATP-dependent DNA helicase RecG
VVGGFAAFQKAFPDDVVMIHGDLAQSEIEASLGLFRAGQRRLAIASTILEIGIDVPDIAVMVVRDADCFGLSQLHQLRGRLARAGGRGDFYMVVDDLDALVETSRSRLDVVQSTTDGYAIAEQDLLLRGFGDLDGAAQSGETATLFRLVNLTARDFVGRQIEQRQEAVRSAKLPAPAKPTWTLPDFVKDSRSRGTSHVSAAPQPVEAQDTPASDELGLQRGLF